MRFERESFNNGLEVFKEEFSEELTEIEDVLNNVTYPMKHTFQSGREHELIFDPVGGNRVIREALSDFSWQSEVNLENPGYGGGKDIDITKGTVAGEIQFGNFAYLDADMNRLQRLHDGRLSLETGTDVEAGIVIVVRQTMPTSQSVSHFQQATTRAAPVALVNQHTCPDCGAEVDNGMPTLIYGIEPPKDGEDVMFNEYTSQRSRTLEDSQIVSFSKKHIPDSAEQSGIEEYD